MGDPIEECTSSMVYVFDFESCLMCYNSIQCIQCKTNSNDQPPRASVRVYMFGWN